MRRVLLLLGVLSVASFSRRAVSAETRVQADFTAQFYDVVSPWGDPVVRRRRYTHTLALDVSDIDGAHEYRSPELAFHTRMRLDADLGQYGAERDPDQLNRYIPGLEEAPLDLMVAYLEGSHYLHGVLGFRIGRQVVLDSLGWWSFDGMLLRLDAPRLVGFLIYAGFEQRGSAPLLSTSRYEADGVLRGDRGDLEQNEWPFYLEQSKLAPAYGASVESLALGALQARLSYRKVINRDEVVVSPFPDENGNFRTYSSDRTSTERAGLSLSMQHPKLGGLGGDAVVDLFVRRVSDVEAFADWYASEQSVLGLGYQYFLPTFDADSIFNWFVQGSTQSAELHASTRLSPRVDVAARAGVRIYQTETEQSRPAPGASPGVLVDRMVSGSARYRSNALAARLDAETQWGEIGHRMGSNLSVRRAFDDGYFDTLGRVSLYDYSDALRPERDATSAGYVIGAGASPHVLGVLRSRFGFEWEHWMNRLAGHRFRLLLTLSVSEFP